MVILSPLNAHPPLRTTAATIPGLSISFLVLAARDLFRNAPAACPFEKQPPLCVRFSPTDDCIFPAFSTLHVRPPLFPSADWIGPSAPGLFLVLNPFIFPPLPYFPSPPFGALWHVDAALPPLLLRGPERRSLPPACGFGLYFPPLVCPSRESARQPQNGSRRIGWIVSPPVPPARMTARFIPSTEILLISSLWPCESHPWPHSGVFGLRMSPEMPNPAPFCPLPTGPLSPPPPAIPFAKPSPRPSPAPLLQFPLGFIYAPLLLPLSLSHILFPIALIAFIPPSILFWLCFGYFFALDLSVLVALDSKVVFCVLVTQRAN